MDDKFATKILNPRLKIILGNRYQDFYKANRVQAPIEIIDGVLCTWGMAPHSGGNPTALSFFGTDGEILAVLKTKNKIEYFGNKNLLENHAVLSAINN